MGKRAFIKPSLSVEDLSKALYEANKELTLINKQLQESEQRRQELLANLSHDLRSPIAIIKNYAEYLRSFSTLDEKEVYSALEHIQSKVQLLEYFISEMLTLTNLDSASEGQLHYEHLKIGLFLEEFFFSAQADLRYKDCTLCLDVPPDFPYYANIETKLMYRVLDNLFTNALRYSHPPRFIALDAQYQNDTVIVSVTDKGIGISESDIGKIFGRTFKVSSARTPDDSFGCGLGLSIVEAIVHKHKGQVWCESTLGEGSTFFFTLPGVDPREGTRPDALNAHTSK